MTHNIAALKSVDPDQPCKLWIQKLIWIHSLQGDQNVGSGTGHFQTNVWHTILSVNKDINGIHFQ